MANFEYDIFLSHSSKDKKEVSKLAEMLQNDGLRVWYDDYVIRGGDDIYLKIEEGLQASRTLVLIMTPNTFESEWADTERSVALFRDPKNKKRRFIPILLKDCNIPEAIKRLKYVDLTINFAKNYQEFLSMILSNPTKRILNRVNELEYKFQAMMEKIDYIQDEISNFNVDIKKIVRNIDYLERLAVLPNYELPNRQDLIALNDIEDKLKGKIVLVKLDLDIPIYKEGKPIDHFKFKRAAQTINHLLNLGSQIILLAGQGLSSIDYLEDVQRGELFYHAQHLEKYLQHQVKIRMVTDFPFSGELFADQSSDKVVMLPNLIDISPMDVLDQKAQIACDTDDEACSNIFVKNLREHYDAFILDDFRSTISKLPSNVGLASGRPSAIGKGIEYDLKALEELIGNSIELGKKNSKNRICICGSSRPNDIIIIGTLLQAKLFDKVLLGPFPSLISQYAKGNKLNENIIRDLTILSQRNGYDLRNLSDKYATSLVNDHKEKLIYPSDYLVVINNEIKNISSEDLNNIDEHVQGIGTNTINNYIEIIKKSSLVFHFGMLGSSKEQFSYCTGKIIEAYAKAERCKTFTAGDHITGIAKLIGVDHLIDYFITGAKTTSYYITGKQLSGLGPFFK